MINQPLCQSHQQWGIPLEIKEFLTTSLWQLSTQNYTNKIVTEPQTLDLEEFKYKRIEVINESSPPNFNPPFIDPLEYLLERLRDFIFIILFLLENFSRDFKN